MDNHEPELTSYHVRRAARLLGMMAARAGDSYDVLEEFAEGWAYVVSGAADEDTSAAHTTPVQSPAGPVAGGEAVFTAAQAAPAPTTTEQLRLQLAILASLQSSVATVIEWRVDDARTARMSWAEIAEPLEVSKQAAHQRYGGMTAEDAVAERYARLSDDDL